MIVATQWIRPRRNQQNAGSRIIGLVTTIIAMLFTFIKISVLMFIEVNFQEFSI
jgi:hypothetical protein